MSSLSSNTISEDGGRPTHQGVLQGILAPAEGAWPKNHIAMGDLA